jgi:hypothetical protein
MNYDLKKKDDLKKIDELIREKLISSLNGGDITELKELTPVINYLKANQEVAKGSEDTGSEYQKELEKANKSRNV